MCEVDFALVYVNGVSSAGAYRRTAGVWPYVLSRRMKWTCKRCVLLFPPVSNRRRFLIHKACEQFRPRGIATFSIGTGDERRTVVCYERQLLSIATGSAMRVEGAQNEESTCKEFTVAGGRGASAHGGSKVTSGGDNIYRPPHMRYIEKSLAAQERSRDIPVKPRRPDRAVYVPRAKRLMSSNDSGQRQTDRQGRIHANSANCPVESKNDVKTKFRIESESDDQLEQGHISQPDCAHNLTPRKIVRKNFYNVYTPPHARVSDIALQKECYDNVENKDHSFAPSNIKPVNSYSVPCSRSSCCLVPNIDSEIVLMSNAVNQESPDKTDNDIDHIPVISNKLNKDERRTSINICSVPENLITEPNSKQMDLSMVELTSVNDSETAIPSNNTDSNLNSLKCDEEGNTNDVFIEDMNRIQKKDLDCDAHELKRASEVINRSNRRIIKQTFVSDVLVIADPAADESFRSALSEASSESRNVEPEGRFAASEKNYDKQRVALSREENDWDALFDDDGECLDPTLLVQLTETVGKVHIQKPRASYEHFQTRGQIMLSGPHDETFGHVLEVYNFPQDFKTHDLLSVFATFRDTGFEIKWVDDTHALAVFSSAKIAAEVLAYNHPIVRTRPLHEATVESRQKAKKSAEFLQPYRPRPETCTALARRLVTGALGVKLSTAKQERLEETRIIKEAREKKRQAALMREAAWEGTLENQSEENS